jgi:hypothetical protein
MRAGRIELTGLDSNLCGTGESPREAAEDLVRRLTNEKDIQPDRLRREEVEQALAEVHAFLEQRLALEILGLSPDESKTPGAGWGNFAQRRDSATIKSIVTSSQLPRFKRIRCLSQIEDGGRIR